MVEIRGDRNDGELSKARDTIPTKFSLGRRGENPHLLFPKDDISAYHCQLRGTRNFSHTKLRITKQNECSCSALT